AGRPCQTSSAILLRSSAESRWNCTRALEALEGLACNLERDGPIGRVIANLAEVFDRVRFEAGEQKVETGQRVGLGALGIVARGIDEVAQGDRVFQVTEQWSRPVQARRQAGEPGVEEGSRLGVAV